MAAVVGRESMSGPGTDHEDQESLEAEVNDSEDEPGAMLMWFGLHEGRGIRVDQLEEGVGGHCYDIPVKKPSSHNVSSFAFNKS